MPMAAKGFEKIIGAWVAPVVALLLLVGAGWFMTWYWFGHSTGISRVDPEIAAALSTMSGSSSQRPPPAFMRFGDQQVILFAQRTVR